jgi:hypothetical protein
MDPFIALERRRSRISQDQENTARLAQSFARYTTTGWGEFKDASVINFDCTFIAEPFVVHGYSTNGDLLVPTRYPRAWGFVHKWKQDNRGYYTGCWVATVVETQSPFIATTVADPGYSLDHCFTFTGIALKDLPTHLLDT